MDTVRERRDVGVVSIYRNVFRCKVVTLKDRWNDIAIFRMYRIVVSGDKTMVSEGSFEVLNIIIRWNYIACVYGVSF